MKMYYFVSLSTQKRVFFFFHFMPINPGKYYTVGPLNCKLSSMIPGSLEGISSRLAPIAALNQRINLLSLFGDQKLEATAAFRDKIETNCTDRAENPRRCAPTS